jgi:hypothetical protein
MEKEWTHEEKENLAHLKNAMMATNKAMILAEDRGRIHKPMSPTDAARFYELLTEAIDESKLVRDDVLRKVHADLPKMFREKYVIAIERILREDSNSDDFVEADRLLNEWVNWVKKEEKRLEKCLPE